MKFKDSIVFILLLMSTSSAFSLTSNTPLSAVPKNLHVYNDVGNTYVDHVSGECSTTRYILGPNHVKYDAILSILLAAQMGGKKVILRYTHNDGCTQGQIIGVYLTE